jgi:hypothetical protein
MAKSAAQLSPRAEATRPTNAGSGSDEGPSLEIPPGRLYASAVQLAHRYGVSVKWIKERKVHLGATRLSDSANSRLRYHLPTADAYMHSRTLTPVVKRRRPRVKRSSGGGGQGLLEFV